MKNNRTSLEFITLSPQQIVSCRTQKMLSSITSTNSSKTKIVKYNAKIKNIFNRLIRNKLLKGFNQIKKYPKKPKVFLHLLISIEKRFKQYAFTLLKLRKLKPKIQKPYLHHSFVIFNRRINQILKKYKSYAFKLLNRNRILSDHFLTLHKTIQLIFNRHNTNCIILAINKFTSLKQSQLEIIDNCKTINNTLTRIKYHKLRLAWGNILSYPILKVEKLKTKHNNCLLGRNRKTITQFAGRKCLNDLKVDLEAHVNLKNLENHQLREQKRAILIQKQEIQGQILNQLQQLKKVHLQLQVDRKKLCLFTPQNTQISPSKYLRIYQTFVKLSQQSFKKPQQIVKLIRVQNIKKVQKLSEFYLFVNKQLKGLINQYEITSPKKSQNTQQYKIQVEKNIQLKNLVFINIREFCERPFYTQTLSQKAKALTESLSSTLFND